MKRRVSLLAVLLALAAAAIPARAQSPRVVQWTDGASSSGRFASSSGIVSKRVTAEGAVVTATIVDEGTRFRLDLTIDNGARSTLDVRPDAVAIEETRPRARDLAYLSARALADGIESDAALRAANRETSGGMATKVVTTTKTEWVTPIGAKPGDPPQFESHTTTEVVPDTDERWRAESDARTIRLTASGEAARLRATALAPVALGPSAVAAGSVYFARDKNVEQIVLRVPLGPIVVEIPFDARKQRVLLIAKAVRFE